MQVCKTANENNKGQCWVGGRLVGTAGSTPRSIRTSWTQYCEQTTNGTEVNIKIRISKRCAWLCSLEQGAYANRLDLVGEVLATHRRGVEVRLDEHAEATESAKQATNPSIPVWSCMANVVRKRTRPFSVCVPAHDAVTVLAFHGSRHTRHACSRRTRDTR